ncbi:MAG: prepilin-type N-terminal cleavage/methylation domain-containing protein [Alphaproteobacteria bacterium]
MKLKKAFSLIELSIVILIIGILVAGVTQSSRLVKQIRLASIKSLTLSSPVSSIKDLAVWLESTMDSSFNDSEKTNGSSVTTWFDINPQSTSKNNATSPSASENPIYLENGINGLPALSSDGTNDVMLINNITDSFVNGFTWIGVLKWTGSGARGYFGLKSDYGNFNNLTSVFLDDCNGANNCFRVTSRADGGLASYLGFNTPSFIKTDPHIISIVRRTNSLMNYDNGAQIGPTVNDATVAGIYRTTSPWAIFKYTNSNTVYFQGVAGEYILIGRAIADDERKDIEKYLAKKWGIKITS